MESLIFQLLVLLAKRAGNYASLLVITPLVSIFINDQIMQVEAMNLTACNLAQKLVSFEVGKFDVVYASTESATDKRFLPSSPSSSLVACVVESHAVET